MSTIKRSIYVLLAIALLMAALPAFATQADDQPFSIDERFEAIFARIWTFMTGADNAVERIDAAERIGADIDSGGVPALPPDPNQTPKPQSEAGAQDR